MSLKERKAKLEQRKRRECRAVTAKYRKLIKQMESKCIEHEFGEWHKRWNGLDNFYQTNFRGEVLYFRECSICGKTQSKID